MSDPTLEALAERMDAALTRLDAHLERKAALLDRLGAFVTALERRYPLLCEADALNRAEDEQKRDKDGARAELGRFTIIGRN